MRRLLLLSIALFFVAVHASAQWVQVSVSIDGSIFQVYSDGSAEFHNSSGNIDYNVLIHGGHSLYTMNKNLFNYPDGNGAVNSHLTNTAATGSQLPYGCNYAYMGGSATTNTTTYSQSMRSNTLCFSDPTTGYTPQPPEGCTPTEYDPCTGGGGGGAGTWNYRDCGYNNVEQGGCASPIVINPVSSKYTLSGEADPVLFDLDGDGARETATWISRDSDVAFLALDRNGNGTIDDGAELFGNHTPLPGGAAAPNGFAALAVYDANGDGIIDSSDPIWFSLLLWTDRNHDGQSSPDEIVPISQTAVTGVELGYRTVGRRDQYGNYFRYKGMARIGNVRRPIYDVFFRIKE